jgi:hypothetical protein
MGVTAVDLDENTISDLLNQAVVAKFRNINETNE